MSFRSSLPVALSALVLMGCPGETAAPTNSATVGSPTQGATPAPAPEKKPFDRSALKTPWKDAKVGDWATYTAYLPNKQLKMKFEITKAEERMVTFTRTDIDAGKLLDTTERILEDEEGRFKPDLTQVDALDGKLEDKTISVAGKDLDVLVFKRKFGGRSTENLIIKQGVPPFMEALGWPVAKSTRDGTVEFDLVDFGSK